MSYPGLDLVDEETQEDSVGTQNVSSASEPEIKVESEKPTPPKLSKAQIKKAVDEMFQVTEAWQPSGTAVRFTIDCPSGQTALVKHLGTMDLVEEGLIEELDFFMRRLFPKNIDPSGNPVEHDENNETLWQSLRDTKKRLRFLDMTGRLISVASLRPKVVFDGVCVRDTVVAGETKSKVVFGYQLSDEDYLKEFNKPKHILGKNETWAGAIDFADRMAFFHELNRPLKQIEPFRPESSTVLRDLAGSEGDELPSQ